MSKLVIIVPAGRRHCGRLVLFGDDEGVRLRPRRVLATASAWAARRHANPTRDWARPFGHAPSGSYVITASLPPGIAPRPRRAGRFGPAGALVLTATGGDALAAAAAGRTRFLIHGGPADAKGRLRPTFGGLRLADRDVTELLRAINEAHLARDPVSSVEIAETDAPSWLRDGDARDRAGRLRPAFASNGAPRPPRGGLGGPALVVLGGGVLGPGLRGWSVGDAAVLDRRRFVGIALLTLGAIGTSGCGAGSDIPGTDDCRCDPVTGYGGQGWAAPRRGRGTSPGLDGGVAVASDAGADGSGPCAGYRPCSADFGGGDVTGGDFGGGGG